MPHDIGIDHGTTRPGWREDTPLAAEHQYVAEMAAIPLLSREEELALARRARAGDLAARDELVRRNLRLAASVAFRYQRSPLPLSDLIQEANIGLMRAAALYDPDRGTHFSTFAIWWIRQRIQRAIDEQGDLIRLPSYRHAEIARYKRAVAVLAAGGPALPTDAQLAAEMGVSVARVRDIASAMRGAEVWSLDEPANRHDPNPREQRGMVECRGDLVADPDEDADTWQERAAVAEEVAELLAAAHLTARERAVICWRHGLAGDSDGETLEQIGVRLDVSRERVRQIEAGALAKLRAAAGIDGTRAAS